MATGQRPTALAFLPHQFQDTGPAAPASIVDTPSVAAANPYRSPSWYRAAEVSLAAVALLLAAPIILVFALLIRLESRGPAFFMQQRLTVNGRPFRFLKLRTMYVDCHKRFPQLAPSGLARQNAEQIRLQIPDDPRVTPLGRWLRRTSLDELPNFWHVVTGDMALVGPRPEIVEMLPHYQGQALDKFSVRPGITGYAQVYGRGELDFMTTVHYDLKYVRERSLRVDLAVLAMTVRCVVTGRGAY